MKKVETQLKNFRYNSNPIIRNTYFITWFISEFINDEWDLRCFSDEEAKSFIDYTVSNSINFLEDNKNCFISSKEEAETYHLLNNEIIQIYLTENPDIRLNTEDNLLKNVILTDSSGKDNHTYNLKFNVIGYVKLVI